MARSGEIGAGGGFAYAAAHAPTVTELTVNRRQRETWEHGALQHLRNGNVATAVDTYLAHGRVTSTDAPADMITTAVEHWAAARTAGLNPVLLAGTNDLVDRLNTAAINHLVATGELDGLAVPFGAATFRVGERIVLRRNSHERTHDDRHITIANGQAGTILHVDDRGVRIRLDGDDDEITIGDRYLARGGAITHAYALTTHRAQGGTWDLAIAVGADGLYREGAYVELSRGIHENHIVLTHPEAAELHRQAIAETERHDTGLIPPDEHPDLETDLTRRLGVSRAKHLAHRLDPDVCVVDHLARALRLTELEHRLHSAHTATRRATDTLGYDGRDLRRRLERLEHVASRIAVGGIVSPFDRHNLGVVTALDTSAGAATVQFTSETGGQASRTFNWDQLRIVEPHMPDIHPLTPDATVCLSAARTSLLERITQWEGLVRHHGAEPDDVECYRRAVDQNIDRAADVLAASQPDWLRPLVGTRPLDPAGAHAWDDSVRSIAAWRARHGLDADATGVPAEWHELSTQLGLTRVWLSASGRLQPDTFIERTEDELIERREALDDILATAPTDWTGTIRLLQAGQLTLDETSDLLTEALFTQGTRREWIIEHWPHIVEYQEVDRALAMDLERDDDSLGIGL